MGISTATASLMQIHNPVSEVDVLWRLIEQFGIDRKLASASFTAPGFTAAHWNELRSYLRQARVYEQAASKVAGISGGLLGYYAHLQLAKCELLMKRPAVVYNQRIGHGLSYQPEAASSMASDFVTVRQGVFSELYEERTGVPIAPGTRLRVRELLSVVPDVTAEVISSGVAIPAAFQASHVIAWDDSHCWYILIADRRSTRAYDSVHRYLKRSFDEVTPLNTGPMPAADRCREHEVMYEARLRVPMADVRPDNDEIRRAAENADLKKFNSVPLYGNATFSPGLRKSTLLPMTSDLARYALMYYVSSLVRYKPSRLDERTNGPALWALDAFVSEARPHLLRSAYYGLSGTFAVLSYESRV